MSKNYRRKNFYNEMYPDNNDEDYKNYIEMKKAKMNEQLNSNVSSSHKNTYIHESKFKEIRRKIDLMEQNNCEFEGNLPCRYLLILVFGDDKAKNTTTESKITDLRLSVSTIN
jgi:hypothetical protein